MGQFSWLDCIDKSQILDNVRADVYVLVPKEFGGGHIHEDYYNGYGDFGIYDIYNLVADWNARYLDVMFNNKDTWHCDWVERFREDFYRLRDGKPLREGVEKRELGITLASYDEDNARLKYPIKITHDPDAVYEDCEPSLSDPCQGWPSHDDDDEPDEDAEWLYGDDEDEEDD